VTFFVLASVRQRTEPPHRVGGDRRLFWVESWDRSRTIVVGAADHDGPWQLQIGSTGLGVAPVLVVTEGSPGVPGSAIADVMTLERPVAMPLLLSGDTDGSALQAMRDLTDPTQGMTRDGNFRLVCSVDGAGARHLELGYRGGLEGNGSDTVTTASRVVLDLVAPLPFAQDRNESSQDFSLADSVTPFLGGNWGSIGLSTSHLLSSGGPIELFSAVPVWPTFTITGPVSSAHITSDTGMDVQVTSAIADGQVLTIVTDPRRRSIRLGDAPAAGMLARGSRFVPFALGTSILTVDAPGATQASKLRLSWRGLHRSLW